MSSVNGQIMRRTYKITKFYYKQTKWLTIYWIKLVTMKHYRLVVGMKKSLEIPKE
jgi:hypothetical protein